ncbi:MAG: hypothetical protein MRZ79_07055 [Bacteroidia bacterium]|nr:hypothetical protein [Bacteroidia bacterium]
MNDPKLKTFIVSENDLQIGKALDYLKRRYYQMFLSWASTFGIADFEMEVDVIWFDAFYKLREKAKLGIFDVGTRKIGPYFYTILKRDWLKFTQRGVQFSPLEEESVERNNFKNELQASLSAERKQELLKLIAECLKRLSSEQQTVWKLWVKTPDYDWEERGELLSPVKSAASMRNIFRRAKNGIKDCIKN